MKFVNNNEIEFPEQVDSLVNQTAGDVNTIFKQIEKLSLFELSRLNCAISNTLNDPGKNLAIKRHLRVGMKIHYFCSNKNKLVEAVILEIRKTKASVINQDDGVTWTIPFYLINLDGVDTTIRPKTTSGGLDKNTLKVGDRVGWHSKLGYDLFGIVEKLNPKKALVRINSDELWTVSYSLLLMVMDGAITSANNSPLCIEGEVIR